MQAIKTLLGLSIIITSLQISAHHSRVEFSGDTIELEGELIDVRWRNPHPTFKLQLSSNPDEVWEIQSYGFIGSLTNQGVSAETFQLGQKVTFVGLVSGRRSNLLLGNNVLLPDGLEVVLKYDAFPYWNGRSVGGSGSYIIDRALLAKAASENKGFFRVWSPESTEITVAPLLETFRSASYSEAALATMENWDITDNPVTRCEPSWMPYAMIQPVMREIIDNGDSLTINIGYFSSSSPRTIYTGNVPENLPQLPTKMGLSIGQWEGNTLVVQTDQIVAPAFTGQGQMQSNEMKVIEKFILSDDQSRLDYEVEIDDPISLEEPIYFKSYYLALGETFSAISCD